MVLVQFADSIVHEVVIMQLDIGNIDMNLLDRIEPPLLPLIQIPQHLLDNPFSYRNNKRGILENGDELHRADSRKTLVIPAKQRLTACPLPGFGVYNGLHDDRKSSEIVVDTLTYGIP